MKFTLEVNLDNAAFEEAPGNGELARILEWVADELKAMPRRTRVESLVHDLNGNTVGSWRIGGGRRPRR